MVTQGMAEYAASGASRPLFDRVAALLERTGAEIGVLAQVAERNPGVTAAVTTLLVAFLVARVLWAR
ncbi:MAG: hypothetical protein RQ751_09910 [Longimicrobiales bacterium]|nr:hypothetical protein [Longimicrobiales bacterium]